jgi:hypothetical protein
MNTNRQKEKTTSKKAKRSKQNAFKIRSQVLKSAEVLIDRIDSLHYRSLNLDEESDTMLVQSLQELQKKLSLFLEIRATVEPASLNQEALGKGEARINYEQQKEKEKQVTNLLNFDSWYRDRSSLPEQKLVQYIGEEDPVGTRKYYRFRDSNGVVFSLDADSVLRRMEHAF